MSHQRPKRPRARRRLLRAGADAWEGLGSRRGKLRPAHLPRQADRIAAAV